MKTKPTPRTNKHTAYANAAARRLKPDHTMNKIVGCFTQAIRELGPNPTNKRVKEALLTVVLEMEIHVKMLPEDDKPAKDIIQIEIEYPDRRKK